MPANPRSESQPVVWNSSHPPAFEYADHAPNEWDLYPHGQTEFIESIDRIETGIGISVRLGCTRTDFDHFKVSVDGGPLTPCQEGVLEIHFDTDASARIPEIQRRETRIVAVSRSGEHTASHHFNVNHVPPSLYLSMGRVDDGYGRVMIRETDLNLRSSVVDDWMLDQPTPDEVRFAETTWGPSIRGLDPTLDQARAIGARIVRDLKDHRGTPSDTLDRVRPFEQYRRLVAGEDRCWCSQLAEILVHACRAFGLEARYIVMGHIMSPREASSTENYSVMLTTGHTTTEIFDPIEGQWCWMDLTYNALGLYLGEEGPLSMLELHRFVNQPARYRRLQVDLCDPATGTVTRSPLAGSPLGERIRNAFRQDQIFRYMRRPRIEPARS